MLDGLDYQRGAVRRQAAQALLEDRSGPRADLQLWMLPAARAASRSTGSVAKRAAITATAGEIARLLRAARRGEITLDGQPLRARRHRGAGAQHTRRAARCKQALAALGIGSVELSQASVFAAPMPRTSSACSRAILEPARSGLLRAALATELLGCDAAAHRALSPTTNALLMPRVERFTALSRDAGSSAASA